MPVSITLVGGPTVAIDIGGLRVVTDPTFDPPGTYPNPRVKQLVKTRGPALSANELMPIDVVLASHGHDDNLDRSGRELLARAPQAFTTRDLAQQFGANVVGLDEYESVRIQRPDGKTLDITAVTAHHGPDGVWQRLGPVLGFVLSGPGVPTVYVSGDNSSVAVVKEVSQRCAPIDIAVLFAGGARFDAYGADAYITLSNEAALEAAKILTHATIVPVHADSWAHLSQDAAEMKALFVTHELGSRIVTLSPGERATLGRFA